MTVSSPNVIEIKLDRLIDDNGEINFWATDAGKTRRPIPLHQPITSISGCSDDLLPPSPPAEKAAARKDQAGEASTLSLIHI